MRLFALMGLFILLAVTAGAGTRNQLTHDGPPDLPPDATREQLFFAYSQFQLNASNGFAGVDPWVSPSARELAEVKKTGLRNIAWLNHINSKRPAGDKLSYSSKATTGGIPIDKPKEYSGRTIRKDFDDFTALMPAPLKEVLIDGKAFTDEPPVELGVFLANGLKIDKLYQTAIRFEMMEPWLSRMAYRRVYDIRGYYFFTKMSGADREKILTHPGDWNADEAAKYGEWLLSMCLNNGKTAAQCTPMIQGEINAKRDLTPLYNRWLVKAKATYDGYFMIQNARRDVGFRRPELLTFPFRDPKKPDVLAFLRDNIEDEWRFDTWSLKMKFTKKAAARIELFPEPPRT